MGESARPPDSSVMEQQRFDRLFNTARAYYHVQDDIFNLQRDQVRRQYRQTLDLLQLECTSEQWAIVLDAIEQEWPDRPH